MYLPIHNNTGDYTGLFRRNGQYFGRW